jgi:hypothetical protein
MPIQVLSKLYPVSGNTIHYSLDALDRVDKISRGSNEVVDFTWSGPRMIWLMLIPGLFAILFALGEILVPH